MKAIGKTEDGKTIVELSDKEVDWLGRRESLEESLGVIHVSLAKLAALPIFPIPDKADPPKKSRASKFKKAKKRRVTRAKQKIKKTSPRRAHGHTHGSKKNPDAPLPADGVDMGKPDVPSPFKFEDFVKPDSKIESAVKLMILAGNKTMNAADLHGLMEANDVEYGPRLCGIMLAGSDCFERIGKGHYKVSAMGFAKYGEKSE